MDIDTSILPRPPKGAHCSSSPRHEGAGGNTRIFRKIAGIFRKITGFFAKQESAQFCPLYSRQGVYNSAVEGAMTRPVHVSLFWGQRF